jgi:hypothetical protein
MASNDLPPGRHSPALLTELEKRERRLDEISDELLATDGRGIDARLREIEVLVLSRLRDIHGRLTGEVPRAKAELTKHYTEITLPSEGNRYRLSGDRGSALSVEAHSGHSSTSHSTATSDWAKQERQTVKLKSLYDRIAPNAGPGWTATAQS